MGPFEALAEPNRRRILDALMVGEKPAGEIGEALSISQPSVSKHLKILKAAGLVHARADGQRRIYRLDPRGMAECFAWLQPHRRFWADRLSALEAQPQRD